MTGPGQRWLIHVPCSGPGGAAETLLKNVRNSLCRILYLSFLCPTESVRPAERPKSCSLLCLGHHPAASHPTSSQPLSYTRASFMGPQPCCHRTPHTIPPRHFMQLVSLPGFISSREGHRLTCTQASEMLTGCPPSPVCSVPRRVQAIWNPVAPGEVCLLHRSRASIKTQDSRSQDSRQEARE